MKVEEESKAHAQAHAEAQKHYQASRRNHSRWAVVAGHGPLVGSRAWVLTSSVHSFCTLETK